MLLAGFGARMIDLKDPPLDFHPTRQFRAAIIARSTYYRWNPQADPENYDFAIDSQSIDYMIRLEPPITETVVALIYTLIGEELLWVSRLVTAFFWCLGGLSLYLFLKNTTSRDAGLIALGFYLFAPFGIIASRSFQPDILMIASMLWVLWAFERWMTHRSWQFAILSGVLSGFSLLVKPYGLFILFTVYATLTLVNIGLFKAIRQGQVWIILGLTAVIPAIYYVILRPATGNFYANGKQGFIPHHTL